MEAQLDARGVLGNFPRFGKLRKGAPKSDKGVAGRDQDFFRLTLEENYEHLRPACEQLFGTEPREFHNVLLAADSPDQAFQYWREDWAHARLLKRCDEETISVHWDANKPGYDTEPMACTCNPLDRTCKNHGRLDIVIPALFELTGEWGKFTVETTSIYDVAALRSYMKMAEVFMQRLSNTAFWSVPFTIGRSMRNVPVTINGKRSIKPMSLLYAKIEPDFNQQVFTPMLMQPARLLLAGVNPETGESPAGGLPDLEAEFIQAREWDRDWVMQQTIHLFDHEDHWINTTNKMEVDGELKDDMIDAEAVQAILENRERRNAEKAAKNGSKSRQKGANSSAAGEQVQSGADWIKDTARLNKFIASAYNDLGMNTGDVAEALRNASEHEKLENIQDFAGSDVTAWAACVAWKCGYSIAEMTENFDTGSNVFKIAARICEIRQQRLADIPF
jgi:hypothetical protein